jgi:hypothetical protein
MTRLRVYTERSLVPPGAPHAPMLVPYWGLNPEEPRDLTSGRWDRYALEGKEAFELVERLEDADVAVYPRSWAAVHQDDAAIAEARSFTERVSAAGSRTLVFFPGDTGEPVPLEHVLVFRTSLFASRRVDEQALPAFIEDFRKRYATGGQPAGDKRERPLVGFCGHVEQRPGMLQRLRGRRPSPRRAAIDALEASPQVDTRFLLRDRFHAGVHLPTGETDYELMRKTRAEYVANMLETDYSLAVRGAGNFSYRLYEVMSCGRIPLFVNTDCVLPYENVLDWKDLCMWIDEDELDEMGARVARTHASTTPRDREERRQRARSAWDDYLSPHGFFRNLWRVVT